MASNSATKLATQQSIKAYVDAQVGSFDTLSEVLAQGNTSGATNLVIDSGQVLTTNTVNETTVGAGVTIDSVLLKDDVVNATDIETSTISANDGTLAINVADTTGALTTTSTINGRDVAADGAAIDRSSGTGVTTSYVSAVAVGGTTFDQPAVSGEINSDEGVFTVQYAGATGITIANLAAASTYVYIDKTGALQQQATVPTRQDWSRKIFTMRVAIDLTTNLIIGFEYLNNPTGHYANSIRDLYSYLLAQGVPFKKDQLVTGRATDLGFDVSSGSLMEFGGTGDINNANIKSFDAVANAEFFLVERTSFDAGGNTDLPKFWDNGGTITALGSTTVVGHRLYRFSNGNLCLQYGQGNYANITLAKAGAVLENFVLNPILANATFFGWWFIESTATNTGGTTLTDFKDYTIGIQGGSSSGLSGALLKGNNLSDLLDAAASRTNIALGTGDTPTFAGLDVTGTVTADGFQTDTANTTTNLLARNSTNAAVYLQNGGTGDVLHVRSGNMSAGQGDLHLKVENNGDISFYEDTGTTPKFFWDASAESLGIGMASPSSRLSIASGSNSTNVGDGITFYGTNTNNQAAIQSFNNGAYKGDLRFYTSENFAASTALGAERMRIDSTGNVGIGTTAPSSILEISAGVTQAIADTGDAVDVLTVTAVEEGAPNLVVGNGPAIKFKIPGNSNTSFSGARIAAQRVSNVDNENATDLTFSTNANLSTSESLTERMRIDYLGNVGIGTTSPTAPLHTVSSENLVAKFSSSDVTSGIRIEDTTTSYDFYVDSGNLRINNTAGSEKMRLDSAGNLLVGTTSSSSNTSGIKLSPTGTASLVRSGVQPLLVNRLTSDGALALFQKDGTTVGSIGAGNNNITINTATTGALQVGGSDQYKWDEYRFYPASDNTRNLGLSTYRWKDLYLSGGVVFGTPSGAVTSNTLDDYEEGTWTPVLDSGTGITYTSQSGRYRKVGAIVYCVAYIVVSNSDSDGSAVTVGGIPFTTTEQEEACVVTLGRYTDFLGAKDTAVTNFRFTGNSILLQQGSNNNITYSEVASSGTLQIAFTYASE